jgi:phosphoribosylanthranilate isomerase
MSRAPLYVKICGITRVEDALSAVLLGATAIGLNFVPTSKRRVDVPRAREIADAVRGKVELVGVVADMAVAEMRALRDDLELDFLQLHGNEDDALVNEMLPKAFKAVRIGDAEDARLAEAVPGDRILADAKVDGALGGTGKTLDWALVRRLAEEHKVLLAGGLTPKNVALAVNLVRPFGVDVASGVETSPGLKDAALVTSFIEAARAGAAR